ncbi:unnamed protein product [Candidula unifasciata]|uniref:PQ-loop repeat-containing protein 2 n=1 Tax=Candidula unifasciata TaxID=100452 RepID=A0A8S4A5Y4_9EUPU|nr:unnamed protein product [Candidula unifasciata]
MPPYFLGGQPFADGYITHKNASNITICPFGVQWIWTVLGDCVSSPQEQASAYLGLISLAIWMMVSLPQVIKNFRNIDGLAGISVLLLLQWAGGDITNLTGAILTSQLKLQIYLASYFVLTDVVLMTQYCVFILRRNRKKKEERRAAADPTPRLILCLLGFAVFSHGICSQVAPLPFLEASVLKSNNLRGERPVLRSLLSIGEDKMSLLYASEESDSNRLQTFDKVTLGTQGDTGSVFWHDKMSIAGYIIGIMSSVFYLGSRLAQIYKNRKLQSTQGLAVTTFMLAVIGNITYAAQILVRDVSTEFLLEKTPWLVGSLGIVGLDCTLLFQFHYYSRRHRDLGDISRALLNKEYVINADEGYTNEFIY